MEIGRKEDIVGVIFAKYDDRRQDGGAKQTTRAKGLEKK